MKFIDTKLDLIETIVSACRASRRFLFNDNFLKNLHCIVCSYRLRSHSSDSVNSARWNLLAYQISANKEEFDYSFIMPICRFSAVKFTSV